MATRKQKHQAALEKRERHLAELARSNSENLKKAQEYRERKNRELWKDQHDQKHSWKKINKDCPHCQDRVRAQQEALMEREADTRQMMANA